MIGLSLHSKMTITFLVIVLCVTDLSTAASVPSYIHVCHRNDPEVTECIKKSVQELLPRLRYGIPDLDVPGLEPLRIDDIFIRSYAGLDINLKLMNMDVYGCSNFTIDRLKLDVVNFVYKIDASFPLLSYHGNYNVNTTILAFPIQGSGIFVANATDLKGRGVLKGDIIEGERGKEMHFTDLDIKFTVDDYRIELDEIIKDNKEFSEILNNIINSNKGILVAIATPLIQEKASQVLLNFANHIVRNFVYDEVFPE